MSSKPVSLVTKVMFVAQFFVTFSFLVEIMIEVNQYNCIFWMEERTTANSPTTGSNLKPNLFLQGILPEANGRPTACSMFAAKAHVRKKGKKNNTEKMELKIFQSELAVKWCK